MSFWVTFVLCPLKATLLPIPETSAQVFPFLHNLSINVLLSATNQSNTFYGYGIISMCCECAHSNWGKYMPPMFSNSYHVSVVKGLDALSSSFSELHRMLSLSVVTLLTKGTTEFFYLHNHNLWLLVFWKAFFVYVLLNFCDQAFYSQGFWDQIFWILQRGSHAIHLCVSDCSSTYLTWWSLISTLLMSVARLHYFMSE